VKRQYSDCTSLEHALTASNDEYVNSLSWLPLHPLLSNFDRDRKEHNFDGSITGRNRENGPVAFGHPTARNTRSAMVVVVKVEQTDQLC
jgi:hypothetical protein